ncbi:MAG TPA: exodeoxyribonuclease VII large subunit, partial [Ktedonobacterales bacterium]|nr:exodeoxyribonuclease VII large subunit [Ktedonobacterales bacterium]
MAISEMIEQALSIGDVMRYLREVFEVDEGLQDLWVRGEISNFTRAASGHCYFSLKDEQATLRCVLFRGNAARTSRLGNGMQVYAHGRMAVYEARGDMQLMIDAIEDAGIGMLYQRFLALKAELEEQGLFAPDRKRAIPTAPHVIGLVTSPDAAALRDIVRTLRLRWPLARVVLAPTLVQGETAAAEIARAIGRLNQHGEAEVIIIARGGGSIEDLWAFNEKVVAYAIAASRIPTVTGIGHEIDFTIADFVAD